MAGTTEASLPAHFNHNPPLLLCATLTFFFNLDFCGPHSLLFLVYYARMQANTTVQFCQFCKLYINGIIQYFASIFFH